MLFLSLAKISRFTNDAAGLEKTLRFLQSLAQVVAAFSSAAYAKPWLLARTQFALCRRFFRFFKFVDAFGVAFEGMTASTGVVAILKAGKWGCLGMYLLLECFTILDAMGIWPTEWAGGLFIEAMKFWFYSISCSIMLNLIMLSEISKESSVKLEEASSDQKPKEAKREKNDRSGLFRKLAIDCCDIFIPGFTTGWLVVSSGTVGSLSMASTLLASVDIWRRVQTPS